MSRILQSVNCLYFPDSGTLPLSQILDTSQYRDLEDYMIKYISQLNLTEDQLKICRMMKTRVKNNHDVYIASCQGTFLDELIVWLNFWSQLGNTEMNIILNLAYGATVHRLLRDDDLLVKPLFRIVMWMKNRGVKVTIGLPLAYGFYPLQYDIHVINGRFPDHAKSVHMIIALRSRTVRDKVIVIDQGKSSTRRRFDQQNEDIVNTIITDYCADKKVSPIKLKKLILLYKTSFY